MDKSLKSAICRFFSWIPDQTYLYAKYFFHMKRVLHLKSPKTFNEKLQWLKLNDRKSLYTDIVDKLEVRSYIRDKIGEEFLIPLLGVWNDVEDIDFNNLPNEFVLKCTHDSGSVIICKDKNSLDRELVKKKLNNSIKQNIFYNGREWPYKDVKPRIIAENLLVDSELDDLRDYKFMCFNGVPKCVFVGTNRQNKKLNITFFDLEWNRLPFERHYHSDPQDIEKPAKLKEMIKKARILAEDFNFVRVDFYEVNGKIYFGELTLFPGSGFEEFRPKEWDLKLGEWLKLPYRNK